jgi:hypothetical protein
MKFTATVLVSVFLDQFVTATLMTLVRVRSNQFVRYSVTNTLLGTRISITFVTVRALWFVWNRSTVLQPVGVVSVRRMASAAGADWLAHASNNTAQLRATQTKFSFIGNPTVIVILTLWLDWS